jgi:hypothetical protein
MARGTAGRTAADTTDLSLTRNTLPILRCAAIGVAAVLSAIRYLERLFDIENGFITCSRWISRSAGLDSLLTSNPKLPWIFLDGGEFAGTHFPALIRRENL